MICGKLELGGRFRTQTGPLAGSTRPRFIKKPPHEGSTKCRGLIPTIIIGCALSKSNPRIEEEVPASGIKIPHGIPAYKRMIPMNVHAPLFAASAKAEISTQVKASDKQSELAKQSKVSIASMASAKAAESKNQWGAPGLYALCRNLTNGDMAAGLLLFRVYGLWRMDKLKRLERFGKEWFAMSRADWARSAGLSENEMKDRALPRLRKSCAAFIEIRTMRIHRNGPNLIWISLDVEEMIECLTPWDMYEPLLNGFGVAAPIKKYPYKGG